MFFRPAEFCTPFPAALKTDEDCEKEFPIEIHAVDYVAASNNPRDARARKITAKVILSIKCCKKFCFQKVLGCNCCLIAKS